MLPKGRKLATLLLIKLRSSCAPLGAGVLFLACWPFSESLKLFVFELAAAHAQGEAPTIKCGFSV